MDEIDFGVPELCEHGYDVDGETCPTCCDGTFFLIQVRQSESDDWCYLTQEGSDKLTTFNTFNEAWWELEAYDGDSCPQAIRIVRRIVHNGIIEREHPAHSNLDEPQFKLID